MPSGITEEDHMAFVGKTPWHGIGTRLEVGVSPDEMLKAAGLDWTVSTHPMYSNVSAEKTVFIGQNSLIRDDNFAVLDVVGPDWIPTQNHEAAGFFNEYAEADKMSMETAGSINGGKMVFVTAKRNVIFDLKVDGLKVQDPMESFIAFLSPHQYGQGGKMLNTPVRVVCQNTIALAMKNHSKAFNWDHRKGFDQSKAAEAMGIATEAFNDYGETMNFLASRKCTEEDVIEYFNSILPSKSIHPDGFKFSPKGTEYEITRGAYRAMENLNVQPGAEIAQGSWYSAFQNVLDLQDHYFDGRMTPDSALDSIWFGQRALIKKKGMELAVKMANKSDDLVHA